MGAVLGSSLHNELCVTVLPTPDGQTSMHSLVEILSG